MTIAEDSFLDPPPNLKIFWERLPRDPPTRLLPSELEISVQSDAIITCKIEEKKKK